MIAAVPSTQAALAAKAATTTVPIVFAVGADPIELGLVASLNRPGGNATGISFQTVELVAKRLGLLREEAARSLKVMPITAPVHSDVEIETAIIALGREPGGGLVALDAFTLAHRAPIISAAARNNVPAVYPNAVSARGGGLLSYGPDPVDPARRAASYVDRILRGEKPVRQNSRCS